MYRLPRTARPSQPPCLLKESLIGIPGEFVKLFWHLVAAPALLLAFLAYAGTYLGRMSFVRYCGRAIYPNVFVLFVSPSHAEFIANRIAEEFFEPLGPINLITAGLVNGLSLTYRLRDTYERLERKTTEPGQNPELVPTLAYEAVSEKRALVTQQIISAASRNTTSAASLRHALIRLFDGENLYQFNGLREGVVTATNPHASVAITCSPDEYPRIASDLLPLFLLSTSDPSSLTEKAAAMFGELKPSDHCALFTVLGAFADAMLAEGGEVVLTNAAQDYVSRELRASSLFIKKALKVGLIYARCARSPIDLEHMRAAVATLRHSRQVETFLRQDGIDKRAMARITEKTVRALEDAPGGLSLTQIHRALRNHVKRDDLRAALTALEHSGRVQRIPTESWPEVWRAVRHPDGEGFD